MAESLTFAIADLHGRLDLLEAALLAIEAYPGPHDKIHVVFLGDYVDRGPCGAQVIARLRAGPSAKALAAGTTWTCLKGNHEEMMEQAYCDVSFMERWLGNGGGATFDSYQQAPGVRLDDHLAWIDGLALLHVDRHRLFVHGGVDPNAPVQAQDARTLLWKRYPTGFSKGLGAYHVVHGHHPHENGPLLYEGRTALDTLAWRTGRLVVAVFDDAVPGGPIDLIECRAQPG